MSLDISRDDSLLVPQEMIDKVRSITLPVLKDFSQDFKGKKISFDGNLQVKQAGVQLDYSQEHIAELLKCKKSFNYFSKYFYIVNKDKGRMRVQLYDFQFQLLNHMVNNRFSCSLLPRQSGKCVSSDTKYNIRNKKTGEIRQISAEEFHVLQKRQSENMCDMQSGISINDQVDTTHMVSPQDEKKGLFRSLFERVYRWCLCTLRKSN